MSRQRRREIGEVTDPVKTKQFHSIVGRWRRAAASKRNSLSFLEIFHSANCNERGVVVYSHGSGGRAMRFRRGCCVLLIDTMNTASKLGPHTQTGRRTCPGVGL